jgi:hypothetical protein
VDSSNNAEAVVLRGSDLDSLADNPDDLAADLQSLAGPSAGPSGSSFYIDGFSTGEMPPKDSIREIRINQNPFSPEFDELGLGRIEIFTKPGSDKFHGSGFFNIGSSSLNSRNPYASIKAPFLLREYGTSLVGPLNRYATFTLDARGDATDNGAVINGAIVDPISLAIIDPYSNVFNVAQHRVLVTPKVDYQIGQKQHSLNSLSLYGLGHPGLRAWGLQSGRERLPRTLSRANGAVRRDRRSWRQRGQRNPLPVLQCEQLKHCAEPECLYPGPERIHRRRISSRQLLRRAEELGAPEHHHHDSWKARVALRNQAARHNGPERLAPELQRNVHFWRRDGARTRRQQSTHTGCQRQSDPCAHHLD